MVKRYYRRGHFAGGEKTKEMKTKSNNSKIDDFFHFIFEILLCFGIGISLLFSEHIGLIIGGIVLILIGIGISINKAIKVVA